MTTTAFKLCGKWSFAIGNGFGFTIGKSKIVWEAAQYSEAADKVIISRVVGNKPGRPFLFGLNYRRRWVRPGTIVNIVKLFDQNYRRQWVSPDTIVKIVKIP